jgi:hypothetical protein
LQQRSPLLKELLDRSILSTYYAPAIVVLTPMHDGRFRFSWLQKREQIKFDESAELPAIVRRILLVKRPAGVTEIYKKEPFIAGSSHHISAMQIIVANGSRLRFQGIEDQTERFRYLVEFEKRERIAPIDVLVESFTLNPLHHQSLHRLIDLATIVTSRHLGMLDALQQGMFVSGDWHLEGHVPLHQMVIGSVDLANGSATSPLKQFVTISDQRVLHRKRSFHERTFTQRHLNKGEK